MTTSNKRRFTVISNNTEFKEEVKNTNKHKLYQTNPLQEKLLKFTNNEGGEKFSIQDLLKW